MISMAAHITICPYHHHLCIFSVLAQQIVTLLNEPEFVCKEGIQVSFVFVHLENTRKQVLLYSYEQLYIYICMHAES